jgi:hypothetical protein
MSTTPQPPPQPIYSLLPAVYRSRDDLLGNPLAAFYLVLECQYGIVKDNLLQLYDDQFIETCAPWVIPYIGALIGYDPVYTVALAGADSRAEVANTIGYRRRKGTLIAMEQVTHDVSGRSTTAIEEFRRLITTLSLRDVRKHHNATADLRRGRDWEDQWGPFTRLNRTVDVRRIAPRIPIPPAVSTTAPGTTAAPPDPTPLDIVIHGGGRFNIPDIAVWMWRWQSFLVTNAPAFSLAAAGNSNGYLFSALGGPIPLFQPAIEETLPFTMLTKEADVPESIRRRRFARHVGKFYPSDLQLLSDGTAVAASKIMCANLEPGPGGEICTVPPGMIAIDPLLGRIQYAATGISLPTTLQVSYNFGSPAQFAGGPYDRTASISQPSSGFLAIVNSSVVPAGYTGYGTLQEAVTAWNSLEAGSVGTIVLPNFQAIPIPGGDLTGANAIQIRSQSQLLIASAEVLPGPWQPATAYSVGDQIYDGECIQRCSNAGASDAAPPTWDEVLNQTTAEATPSTLVWTCMGPGGSPPLWNKSCVTLFGNIEVHAPAAPLGPDGLSEPMGSLQISGVWLSGAIILTGAAACVQMTDCTLVPGISLNPDGTAAQPGTPSVTGTAIGATLCLTRAICGPVSFPESCSVRVCDSIVDAGSASSPAFVGPAGYGIGTMPSPGAELHIEDSTVIGKVYAQAIRLASNTIFHSALAAGDVWNAAVWANRTQVGCVRFCSLPWSSIVPRRYECLPPDAASEQALAPQFISLRFGDPAYCLLSGDCPVAVWKGADNRSQMGVFLQTQETEAVENIQIRANEYLVANLECGVFLIPSHRCDTVLEKPGGINQLPPAPPGHLPFPTPEPGLPLQHDVAAPAITEPNADEEAEPLKADDAPYGPVATVETEAKADANSETPKVEVAPIGAEPDLHTALPDLHETQTPGAHTEGQDGS